MARRRGQAGVVVRVTSAGCLAVLTAACGSGSATEQDTAADELPGVTEQLEPVETAAPGTTVAVNTGSNPSAGGGSMASGDTTAAPTGVDGPLLRREPTAEVDDDMALVEGTLELSGECLYVANATPATRYPIIWPSRASWKPERQSVLLSPTDEIAIGDQIEAGGGFLTLADVEVIADDEATAAAAACLDNDTGEIVVLNTENGEIAVVEP